MRILNSSKGITLVQESRVADNFWTRFKGLLGTRMLAPGQGLVIRPCSSVHTLGMHYPIDVLFVDNENRVLKVVYHMPPGRTAISEGSAFVIELPAGLAVSTETRPGDIVAFYP